MGVRADSTWDVPEAELGLVLNAAGQLFGYTLGNDMSSRDIEGANPLYLPQAKVYTASCAMGPGILLNPSTDWPEAMINITIERDGTTAFDGSVHTDRIKRTISELARESGADAGQLIQLIGRGGMAAVWSATDTLLGRPVAIKRLHAGLPAEVVLVIDAEEPIWSFAGLPSALPPGVYRIDGALKPAVASRAALGWCLGSYAFTRYKENPRTFARLVWPKAADEGQVTHTAEAIALVRDLINTRYPSHGIIGEEFGSERTDAEFVWVLDPVDGTKSFICGVPLYGVLIGVEVDGPALRGRN